MVNRSGTQKSYEISLLSDDPKKIIHQAEKWKERKDEVEELKKIFVQFLDKWAVGKQAQVPTRPIYY